jgi:hypothetical protein
MNPYATVRSLAWATLLMFAIVARSASADAVGWVAALEGTADRQRGGSWEALAAGAEVEMGDHVRTQQASRMKLLFKDDSVLTLAERSELVIDQQVVGAATVSSFSLLLGKVRAIVTDRYSAAGSAFEVKSPTAIAGVRGTSFLAEFDAAKDETLVVGLESTTAVRGAADVQGVKEVRLGPGQATRVRRGGDPTRPFQLPDTEIRSLTDSTTTADKGKDGTAPRFEAEPRVPKRPADRAKSPEERVVDQPGAGKRKTVPPPPPIP